MRYFDLTKGNMLVFFDDIDLQCYVGRPFETFWHHIGNVEQTPVGAEPKEVSIWAERSGIFGTRDPRGRDIHG